MLFDLQMNMSNITTYTKRSLILITTYGPGYTSLTDYHSNTKHNTHLKLMPLNGMSNLAQNITVHQHPPNTSRPSVITSYYGTQTQTSEQFSVTYKSYYVLRDIWNKICN